MANSIFDVSVADSIFNMSFVLPPLLFEDEVHVSVFAPAVTVENSGSCCSGTTATHCA
jgi:hypothetical protein